MFTYISRYFFPFYFGSNYWKPYWAYVNARLTNYMVYTTGAQEWHIMLLLGDITSPTTVAHYVTMTSDLRVLITEVLTAAPTAHGVHTQTFRVRH